MKNDIDFSKDIDKIKAQLKRNEKSFFGKEAQQLVQHDLIKIEKKLKRLLKNLLKVQLLQKKKSNYPNLISDAKKAMSEAYSFIEQMREWITKEAIDYLLLFEDTNQELSLAKAAIKDLLPFFTTGFSRTNKQGEREIRLYLNSTKQLQSSLREKNLFLDNTPLIDSLKRFYQILTKNIQTYINKGGESKDIQQGRAFETAAEASVYAATRALELAKEKEIKYQNLLSNDPTVLEKELTSIYIKNISDSLIFFKGGDLNKILSLALLKNNTETKKEIKQFQLQLKSLVSGGAQIIALPTLIKTLEYMLLVLFKDKNNFLKNAEKFFIKSVDGSDKNKKITDMLKSALGKSVNDEIEKLEKEIIKSIRIKNK